MKIIQWQHTFVSFILCAMYLKSRCDGIHTFHYFILVRFVNNVNHAGLLSL